MRWMRLRPASLEFLRSRAEAGALRSRHQQSQGTPPNVGEGSTRSHVDREAEVLRIEVDRGRHIVDDVAHARILIARSHHTAPFRSGTQSSQTVRRCLRPTGQESRSAHRDRRIAFKS